VAYNLVSQILDELCFGPDIREKVLQGNILDQNGVLHMVICWLSLGPLCPLFPRRQNLWSVLQTRMFCCYRFTCIHTCQFLQSSSLEKAGWRGTFLSVTYTTT